METQRRNGAEVKLPKPKTAKATAPLPEFNAQAFLDSIGVAKTVVKYGRGEAIFTQGETCEHVLYIQSGGVKLSVLSKTGREAVVAMLGPGGLLRRGVPGGSDGSAWAAPRRSRRAPSCVVRKRQDGRTCCTSSSAMSDRFISHMLSRNIRIEEDLIDQLFNSSEKRLARTLLLLARYGKQDKPVRMVPKISQETLAEMVGTTRSRVNFFLNKFKKLGFIEYSGELPIKINSSLLSVVLHD